MEYLFDRWDRIERRLKNKYLFLLLDFDGTLAPIVRTPDKAVLPEATRKLLNKFSNSSKWKLAFISGRSFEDIKSKIGLKNVIYSGNHGLEIEGPNIKFKYLVSPRYKMVIKHIRNELEKKIASIKGAFIEDKGFVLSLHYRLVDKKQVPLLKAIFHETVITYLVSNKIKIKTGKKVLEVRPPLKWDKGSVVLWLLARQVFAAKENVVFPIYIGDDLTDEDAFKALKNKGLTVLVGRPKDSYAQYYLRNPNEVVDFLRRILEINI